MRVSRIAGAACLAGMTSMLAACGGGQSTLRPESDAARDIATLWWIVLTVSVVVFGVVLGLVVFGVLRARGAEPARGEPLFARGLIVIGGVAVPMVVLVALFVLTLRTLPSTSPARGKTELTVEVVGRQWFWDIHYLGRGVTTANEVHIPARTPVELRARSLDVIHSFWLPRLNRKIDMIPGRTNSILLNADEPGVYRGQCAEFCGLQHAKMAFLVVVEEPNAFRRWLERQAEPSRAGSRGARVFLASGCGSCHSIRGTTARGRVGPDLSHLASRRTLAAGTIPNDRGSLAAWIIDPQHFKHGSKMPGFDLAGDLGALLDYLEGLR